MAFSVLRTPSNSSRHASRAAHWSVPIARASLFVVYAWFGILKVLGQSPATGLVHALHQELIGFVDFDGFMLAFGAFEVLVGVLFLVPKLTRVALTCLALHVFTTVMPLLVLPHVAWQHLMVPTLEGQYIIKNVLIVAAAVTIAGERSRTSADASRNSAGRRDAATS